MANKSGHEIVHAIKALATISALSVYKGEKSGRHEIADCALAVDRLSEFFESRARTRAGARASDPAHIEEKDLALLQFATEALGRGPNASSEPEYSLWSRRHRRLARRRRLRRAGHSN